jgi:hypothetical protein
MKTKIMILLFVAMLATTFSVQAGWSAGVVFSTGGQRPYYGQRPHYRQPMYQPMPVCVPRPMPRPQYYQPQQAPVVIVIQQAPVQQVYYRERQVRYDQLPTVGPQDLYRPRYEDDCIYGRRF